MGFSYVPPPIIYQVEESRVSYGKPYYYECGGRILNLAAATQFYVDHIPLTSLYWPCVKIAGTTHQLTASMNSREEAMKFLRELTEKIETGATPKFDQ